MARYLVVAHQTAASPELIERLKELCHPPEDSTVLLVPATPVQHLLTWEEGAHEQAQSSALNSLAVLKSAGLNPEDAIIGDPDPMRAIESELSGNTRPYEAVVISTFPQGLSRWLKQDLPRQVERRLTVRVIHVVSQRPSANKPSKERDEVDSGGWDLRGLGEWRGKPVLTSDGHRLSQVSEIIYDPVTRKPVWIAATDGRFDVTPTLIPALASKAEGDHLRVSYTWDFLNHEPDAAVGEGFSSFTDEAALYEYFGLLLDGRSDLRVLHAGQEYPDSLSYPGSHAA